MQHSSCRSVDHTPGPPLAVGHQSNPLRLVGLVVFAAAERGLATERSCKAVARCETIVVGAGEVSGYCHCDLVQEPGKPADYAIVAVSVPSQAKWPSSNPLDP